MHLSRNAVKEALPMMNMPIVTKSIPCDSIPVVFMPVPSSGLDTPAAVSMMYVSPTHEFLDARQQ